MWSELTKLLGVIPTDADNIVAQVQAWVASYPVILLGAGLFIYGLVKKIIGLAVTCGAIVLAICLFRMYLLSA